MRTKTIRPDPFEVAVRDSEARTRLFAGSRRALVAVSGGPDSMALLYALARRRAADATRPELAVAHLDHGLRGDASREDATFVAARAADLGLACEVGERDVAAVVARRGGNLEAVARELRYAFLAGAAARAGADRVATGHTATDQAETVLMRLARGAGSDGLAGIAASRPLASGIELIRPLLSVSREEVLAYCARREIPFRVDATNDDDRLSRVYARRELLPRLERLSPGAVENFARAAALGADDRAYFAERVAALLAEWGVAEAGSVSLPADDVAALPAAIRRRVLREAVRRVRGDLRRVTFEHVEALERLLGPGRDGREATLPLGLRARRERGVLVVGLAVVK